MDTKHVVEIRRQNSGIRFIAGVAAIVLLWKFRSFFYDSGFSLFATESGENLSSTSLLIVQILLDSVIFIGGIVIFIATGIWAVVWDLIEGARLFVKKRTATNSAVADATIEAQSQAVTQAVAPKTVDAAKLKEVLTKLELRIKTLEDTKAGSIEVSVLQMVEAQKELLARLN